MLAARSTDSGDLPAVVGFRPARPDDVDAAVPMIYSSGPSAFDYVFAAGSPDGARAFLRHAFLKEAGEFSYRSHDVAVIRGTVVGVGAIFDGRHTLRFTLAAAAQIFGCYGLVRALGVITRGLRVEAIIRPPRPRELYLCHLGVDERLRGTGVGTRLIEHLLERRRADLHDCVALDVAVTNPRAEALYRRLGFSITAVRRSKLSNSDGAVADHRRMTRR